jgi:hypothetical protein
MNHFVALCQTLFEIAFKKRMEGFIEIVLKQINIFFLCWKFLLDFFPFF